MTEQPVQNRKEAEAAIQKLKDAISTTEPEVRSEYQTEIEKAKHTIKIQEHALRVNKLILSTLTLNDYFPEDEKDGDPKQE